MKRTQPLRIAVISCALLVVGGIAGIGFGYVMVARTVNVFDQVPAMVSGGLGGIGLVIVGCVFGYVQIGRACSERERADEEHLLGRIGVLADLERRRIATAATAAKQSRRTTAKRSTA